VPVAGEDEDDLSPTGGLLTEVPGPEAIPPEDGPVAVETAPSVPVEEWDSPESLSCESDPDGDERGTGIKG